MDFNSVGNVLGMAYQYASRTQKNTASGTSFTESLQEAAEKAAYYEQKMDDFFEATPQLSASFAAKGLVYEPGGVVVHEDGSVTYIGGCSDSPERVAEVNAINIHIVNQSKVMAPAVAAYENVISTFSNSVIENM